MPAAPLQPNHLPSFSYLARGGVLPYDIDTYIYGTPCVNPYPMQQPVVAPKAPALKPQSKDTFMDAAGKTALVGAAAVTTGAVLKKKLPDHAVTKALQKAGDFLKTIPSKIVALFKKAPKPQIKNYRRHYLQANLNCVEPRSDRA